MLPRQFASQKALLDYAEQKGLVYCAERSSQYRSLFRSQELAGATSGRRFRVAAQRNRPVPAMPSAEI